MCDGRVVAAAQEERFTRRKGEPSFPAGAAAFCLRQAGISMADVELVAFHEKPWLHFERLLETHLDKAPRGWRGFLRSMPPWIGGKLFMRRLLRSALRWEGPVVFTEHHEAHLGAAFFPSPFESAAALSVDGVGEWATTCWGMGRAAGMEVREEIHFPHSVGLLYSAITAYLGFRVNSGEYKVMGLAPYGEPRYVAALRDQVVELRDDGSFFLNPECFDFTSTHRMTTARVDAILGGPPRAMEGPMEQRHADVARSLQVITEEILLGLVRHVHRQTGVPRLVLGGGVALNCVANARILHEGPFEELWIQPAAGDAGSALGCALVAYHGYLGRPRTVGPGDTMCGTFLGPSYTEAEIRAELDALGAEYQRLPEEKIADHTASLLAEGAVVGWFQGSMEFGPRALGARSILADPRREDMQRKLNLKIKFRESFRPFAPAVPADRCSEYFDPPVLSPYMLLVSSVAPELRISRGPATDERSLSLRDRPRSKLPAITHVDDSARLQTVDGQHNSRFFALLEAYARRTGTACLVNTSFNVRGEPIVCGPGEAYRCFRATDMDYLVMGNLFLDKASQNSPSPPLLPPKSPWRPPPDGRHMRRFGWLLGGLLLVLSILVLPRSGGCLSGSAGSALRYGVIFLGALLILLGTARPVALSRVYGAWMVLARALNRVTSPVLLTLLFFLAVTPIGVVHRHCGGMRRWRWPASPEDPGWQEHKADPRGSERYLQQF